jgi:hypothetical protein
LLRVFFVVVFVCDRSHQTNGPAKALERTLPVELEQKMAAEPEPPLLSVAAKPPKEQMFPFLSSNFMCGQAKHVSQPLYDTNRRKHVCRLKKVQGARTRKHKSVKMSTSQPPSPKHSSGLTAFAGPTTASESPGTVDSLSSGHAASVLSVVMESALDVSSSADETDHMFWA